MSFLALLLGIFTLMELNCENLFDTKHDSLKQDQEFLPESYHRWNDYRYWCKLEHIGQEIVSNDNLDNNTLPDLVALCEVENDSVCRDLTKRSLLRTAGYEYIVTNSPDVRGVDVALLYQPSSFRPINHYSIRVTPIIGMRSTRDILYACGTLYNGDTLHVFVVHMPSRRGGEKASRPFRMCVAERLCESVDSIRNKNARANIIITGDFNDYSGDKSIVRLFGSGLLEISAGVEGRHGAKGTYKHKGRWGSLDHILCTSSLAARAKTCFVVDYPFLLESDKEYGGMKPFRNFNGFKWQNGFSDHLPLIAQFEIADF
jgi:endonuclease/exonuclease/phosphatase family metal-dependent hydrolase